MNQNPLRISQNSIDLDDLISDLHEQSDAQSSQGPDMEAFACVQVSSTLAATKAQLKKQEPQTKHNNFTDMRNTKK